MTPEEQAALARQKRIAKTPEIRVERREPLDGQGTLFPAPPRAIGKGWRGADGDKSRKKTEDRKSKMEE